MTSCNIGALSRWVSQLQQKAALSQREPQSKTQLFLKSFVLSTSQRRTVSLDKLVKLPHHPEKIKLRLPKLHPEQIAETVSQFLIWLERKQRETPNSNTSELILTVSYPVAVCLGKAVYFRSVHAQLAPAASN